MTWTLVTGAAKGLGSQISLSLAGSGRNVVVHYNASRKEAENIVGKCRELGVKAEWIQGDFSSNEKAKDFISRYLERFTETSVLINNVGNYLLKSATETDLQEWEQLLQTNLTFPFMLSNALIPSLKKTRGHLINIGVNGIYNGRADTYATAYSITKHGLWMLTKSLAKELAPHAVRVNMVSPGLMENAVDLEAILPLVPMKTATSLNEVAGLITFLLKPENAHLTGQNIEVAGGLRL